MSTNPFRRSSFKGPNVPSATADPIPIDVPDVSGTSTPPLFLNTRVPSSTQKHVVFASPPGTAIPPVSYPPSPESTRISPAFHLSQLVPPGYTDYSDALQSDPFQAETLTDEDDAPIEEALQKARKNPSGAPSPSPAAKEDAVRNTLSRFAGAPRGPASATDRSAGTAENASAVGRPAMDVDAFKRLLLTGNSGPAVPKTDTSETSNQPRPNASESSSSADTASISQQSLFEPVLLAPDDSPRTSHEFESLEADSGRRRTAIEKHEVRKKPALPRPRHGRPIREDESAVTADFDPASHVVAGKQNLERTTSAPSPLTPAKRPPTPPLTRRQSQKSGTPKVIHNHASVGDAETANISSTGSSRAPPPPRSRRPESLIERRSSVDLPSTAEEPGGSDGSLPASRKSSGSRPPPPPVRTPSSNKHMSLGAMNPPPLPPPRRNRGSSRSSIDSHRPSMSIITGSGGNNGSARSSGEFARPGGDSRRTSGIVNTANDILADLAALQREVDQARKRGDQ